MIQPLVGRPYLWKVKRCHNNKEIRHEQDWRQPRYQSGEIPSGLGHRFSSTRKKVLFIAVTIFDWSFKTKILDLVMEWENQKNDGHERNIIVCILWAEIFCSTPAQCNNFRFGLFEIFCQFPFCYHWNIITPFLYRVSRCILVRLVYNGF